MGQMKRLLEQLESLPEYDWEEYSDTLAEDVDYEALADAIMDAED